MGTPDRVVVYNHPSNLAYQLDYNGGFYAQDSWTVDRLTLDYGMRLDFAAMSVPDAPRGLGRFVPAQRQPGRPASDLPRFGPDLSPRLSVAYDLFGDARTVLKHRAGRHRHRRAKHRRHVVPHDPGEQREVPAVLVAARRERPEGVRRREPRYDVRLELFNALNNGVDLEHDASRNARGSTGAGYQALNAWERANRILEGRIVRLAVTAAF